jgi:curli biogenesis system outer membrane secretion channel CsgG
LAAVEAHDTVMSYGVQGGGVRSFSGRIFEADAGFTRNEVLTIVTRRAIAKALLQLIEEAAEREIWPMGSSQREALEHTMISLRALDYSGSELK